MKNIYLYILLFSAFSGCKPKLTEFTPSPGSADFSRYVAVGNSLTAGYADGALYRSGQINSYPNMLAQQFATVGGGEFKQPLMVDDHGIGVVGNTPVTKFILGLVKDCGGVYSLSPMRDPAGINLGNLAPIGSQGPYNNLGVPGAKSFQLLTPLLAVNPYYGRFASSPGSSTVITDALSINPTFFTLWIGSNDVLLYSVSGGEKGGDSITEIGTFTYALTNIVAALKSKGAKGAIANVPDITNIPYFTTVPYNGLVLTNQAQVDGLNAAYKPLNIKFSLGQNPFIIKDQVSGYARQIKSSEFLLLSVPQDSIKCHGWGSQVAIPSTYVLDSAEISEVKKATINFNNVIANLAAVNGLALVDMNKKLAELAGGIVYDGISFKATFVTGGAFSLDGIHLNPRGYALIANYYIDAINQQYGSKVPTVEVTNYPGILFP